MEGRTPQKDSDEPTKAVHTIVLPPNAVLMNLAINMNGKVKGIETTLPVMTTWKTALDAVSSSIKDDHEIQLHHPLTRARREVLRARALSEVRRLNSLSEPNQPLKIRNAIDSRSLPIPSPLTTEQKKKLKENVHRLGGGGYDPYVVTIRAGLEERKLVGISGSVVLTAIDGIDEASQELLIKRDDMIWDTGAHTSFVSEALLDDDFRNHLQDPIHDPYRDEGRATIQLSGVFKFSNATLQIATTCTVVPFLPNNKVGILLGQAGLIDQISYRMIPRAILEAKGETVEDGEYGDIIIEEFVNFDGQVVQAFPAEI